MNIHYIFADMLLQVFSSYKLNPNIPMPESPPNVGPAPLLSEHIMQAAQAISPGAPGNLSYGDLDHDAKHAAVSGYVRAFHQWAMNAHGLHAHDPVTGKNIPQQEKPLLVIVGNSMTLAFPENIKRLEEKILEHTGDW